MKLSLALCFNVISNLQLLGPLIIQSDTQLGTTSWNYKPESPSPLSSI
jgi:hypothetical protein